MSALTRLQLQSQVENAPKDDADLLLFLSDLRLLLAVVEAGKVIERRASPAAWELFNRALRAATEEKP